MLLDCLSEQRLGYSQEVHSAFPTYHGNPFQKHINIQLIPNLISRKYKYNSAMHFFLQNSDKTDVSFNPGIFSVILFSIIYVIYLICISFF